MPFSAYYWTLNETINWVIVRSESIEGDPTVKTFAADRRMSLDLGLQRILALLQSGDLRAVADGETVAPTRFADAQITHGDLGVGYYVGYPIFENGPGWRGKLERFRINASDVQAQFPRDEVAPRLRLVSSRQVGDTVETQQPQGLSEIDPYAVGEFVPTERAGRKSATPAIRRIASERERLGHAHTSRTDEAKAVFDFYCRLEVIGWPRVEQSTVYDRLGPYKK